MSTVAHDGFAIAEIGVAARRRWWWPVGGAVVGLAAGLALAFLSQPVYRAEAVVVPVTDQESAGALSGILDQVGGLASLAGLNLGVGKNRAQSMAILKSRALVDQLIRDEDLIPVLYAKLWDAENRRWDVEDPAKAPTPYKAAESFLRYVLKVEEDRNSGAVTVAVEWTDPVLAARWANGIVARANAAAQSKAIGESEASVRYLEEQLVKTESIELRQAIFRLMEVQLKQIVAARSRPDYAFRVVDPAQAADPDRFVKPKRRLLVVLMPVAGALAGLFVAVVLLLWSRGREDRDGQFTR